ncbi:hypothetical protein CF326_g1534 [Tilletia indica]|nr:hypothetical protein CF326_g1534 [Tilletia indica]
MNYISSAQVKDGLCKKIIFHWSYCYPPGLRYNTSPSATSFSSSKDGRKSCKTRSTSFSANAAIPSTSRETSSNVYRLATTKNASELAAKLVEYASEVVVDFARKAVRSFGRLNIKIEAAAERCFAALLRLIQTKVSYVVQEAVVVIKDIFRKYPNQYEGIIATLCENLDTLDGPGGEGSHDLDRWRVRGSNRE